KRWSPAWGRSHTRSRRSTGLGRCSPVPLIVGPARLGFGGFSVGLDLVQLFGRQQITFPPLGYQLLCGGAPCAEALAGHRGHVHSLPPPCGRSCESHGTPVGEIQPAPEVIPEGRPLV